MLYTFARLASLGASVRPSAACAHFGGAGRLLNFRRGESFKKPGFDGFGRIFGGFLAIFACFHCNKYGFGAMIARRTPWGKRAPRRDRSYPPEYLQIKIGHHGADTPSRTAKWCAKTPQIASKSRETYQKVAKIAQTVGKIERNRGAFR